MGDLGCEACARPRMEDLGCKACHARTIGGRGRPSDDRRGAGRDSGCKACHARTIGGRGRRGVKRRGVLVGRHRHCMPCNDAGNDDDSPPHHSEACHR